MQTRGKDYLNPLFTSHGMHDLELSLDSTYPAVVLPLLNDRCQRWHHYTWLLSTMNKQKKVSRSLFTKDYFCLKTCL